MAEAGYLIGPLMLSPSVRFEKLAYASPNPQNPSETRVGGGLAFWPYGHNSNIKASFARATRDPGPPPPGVQPVPQHPFNQINLQWQVYFY